MDMLGTFIFRAAANSIDNNINDQSFLNMKAAQITEYKHISGEVLKK